MEPFKDYDKYLYKFVGRDGYKLFEKKRIILTPAAHPWLNDPDEGFACLKGTSKGYDINFHKDLIGNYENIKEYYASTTQNCDLITFHKNLFIDMARRAASKIYGIISTTSAPKDQIMWAHYAEKGLGFVVVLNKKHRTFKKSYSHQKKKEIIYSVLTKEGFTKASIDMFDRMLYRTVNVGAFQKVGYGPDKKKLNYLHHKSEEWEPEQEHRYVDFLANAFYDKKIERHFLPLSSTKAISGIIFNYRKTCPVVFARIAKLKSEKEWNHLRYFMYLNKYQDLFEFTNSEIENANNVLKPISTSGPIEVEHCKMCGQLKCIFKEVP